MSEPKPKKHNKLNQRQIDLLYALYRFRFGTTDLLAELIGKKSGVIIYSRLKLLVEQGYIGRNFDSTYRIRGKHATYFLLPKAFKALQEYAEAHVDSSIVKTDARAFKRIYKDKEASEQFVAHCLAVLEAHNTLRKEYSDLKFFTKSDLTLDSNHYFPKVLPDAFISYKDGKNYSRFFVDVFERGTPFFLMMKRIKQHIAYFESGEWEVTKSTFPVIVMICETAADQKKLERRVAKSLENAGVDDLVFKVIGKEELTTSFDLLLRES